MADGALGERIAAYRRRRGLSQAALAGLVGRSESWLSQVERGLRSVDRLSVLLDMAQVLKVDVEALIGRPWVHAPNGSHLVEGVEGLRRYLGRYEHLLGDQPAGTVSLANVRAQVADAHSRYQAAEYQELVELLPPLLAMVDAMSREPEHTEDRREMLLTFVSAYVVTAKLLTKLGAGDLAMVTADRSATAALEANSWSARGMAAYQVVCALLRSDRTDDAEHLAVEMACRLSGRARSDEPTLVSVAGALWLIAAVIAARRTDQGETWARIDRAEKLADLLGEDANYAWTAFGPTNVAIHRVSVAAELGDAGEALNGAASVDPTRLPEGLLSRRVQMHVDLAWAQAQRKRDAEATLHLLEAERTAPEAVHYGVLPRELMREMLARGGRLTTSSLHDLAIRAGVLG